MNLLSSIQSGVRGHKHGGGLEYTPAFTIAALTSSSLQVTITNISAVYTTYSLYMNGSLKGSSSSSTITATGLSDQTTYTAYIIASNSTPGDTKTSINHTYYNNVCSSSNSYVTFATNTDTISNVTATNYEYFNGVWRHSASQSNTNAYDISNVGATTYIENGVYSGGTVVATRGYYTGAVTTTVSGSTISGEWVQIELPYSLQLSKYTFGTNNASYNRWASEWTVAGSNDGNTWSLVHSPGTYYSNNNHANRVASSTNTLTSLSTAYKCYRVIVQRVANTSTSTKISLINMLYLYGIPVGV